MSFKPEVKMATSSTWAGNGLVFETEAEAAGWLRDLEMRWFADFETRVAESDEPVRHAWVENKLENIE